MVCYSTIFLYANQEFTAFIAMLELVQRYIVLDAVDSVVHIVPSLDTRVSPTLLTQR